MFRFYVVDLLDSGVVILFFWFLNIFLLWQLSISSSYCLCSIFASCSNLDVGFVTQEFSLGPIVGIALCVRDLHSVQSLSVSL